MHCLLCRTLLALPSAAACACFRLCCTWLALYDCSVDALLTAPQQHLAQTGLQEAVAAATAGESCRPSGMARHASAAPAGKVAGRQAAGMATLFRVFWAPRAGRTRLVTLNLGVRKCSLSRPISCRRVSAAADVAAHDWPAVMRGEKSPRAAGGRSQQREHD